VETFGFKPVSEEEAVKDESQEDWEKGIVMRFPDYSKPPDEKLDTRSVAMLVKANAFQCVNPDAYKDGDLAVSECAALVKRIKEIHDPVCKATNLAHKASTKARKDLIDPIEQASKIIDTKLGNYKMAHDRKIAEEAKVLQEKAQKEQREAAVIQAEQMKKEGAVSEVIDLVLESADDPVEAPKPETPQLHSKNSRTLDWKIQIIDKSLVPDHYKTILVDEVSILKKVRTEKGNLTIPGVRIEETFKTRRKAL